MEKMMINADNKFCWGADRALLINVMAGMSAFVGSDVNICNPR